MYTITDTAAVNMIESYCRSWRIIIMDRSSGRNYMGESVMRADSDISTTADSDDIEFGAVCAGEWTMSVYNPDKVPFLGNEIDIRLCLARQDGADTELTWADLVNRLWGSYSGYTWEQISQLNKVLGEPIPMGSYICIKARNSGDVTELTLCDRLYFSDKEYVPGITLPASCEAVEQDILDQLGIENGTERYVNAELMDNAQRALRTSDNLQLIVSGYSFTISSGRIPEGCTMRQMLGYIASCLGQFGYIDRFGRYVRKWYGRSVKTIDPNTADTPTLSEKPNRITGLICTSGENTYTAGDITGRTGRVIEFENPFMTQTLFNSLWRRLDIEGFEWYTAELYHRLGDPRFDPGDVITYDGCDIPITTLSYGFDGGLWANISAAGRSYEEEVLPT